MWFKKLWEVRVDTNNHKWITFTKLNAIQITWPKASYGH